MAAAPVTVHEVCGEGQEARLLFDSTVVQVGAVTNIKSRPNFVLRCKSKVPLAV